MSTTITSCVCGETQSKAWAIVESIPIVECTKCGVRRVLHLNKEDYISRYTSGSYHAEDRHYDTGHPAHAERREHDAKVAQQRLDVIYALDNKTTGKLLDVGCSNGAFVDTALAQGYDAYGCDLSIDAVPDSIKNRVRKGDIASCKWQRREFDVITFNDVLEHIPDPIAALKVAAGLLKRTGILVVDIPDMGCAAAKEQGPKFKHVKPREHLWYFTANQLRDLLESNGFNVVQMKAPIPGKVTAYACPVADIQEVTIYGPPGIGDIMWTMCKLKGIREREAPCIIKYVVCVDGQQKLAERAKDFMLLSGLIDVCDFQPIPLPNDAGNTDPSKAEYELIANDWIQPRIGTFGISRPLEDWRPELATDYDLEIEIPEAALKQAELRLGDLVQRGYVAVYMSSHVWNRATTIPEWDQKDWAYLCIKLVDAGLKPVLIGAGWDQDFAKDVIAEIVAYGREPNLLINTIGKTPIALAMAYMQLAKVTVGICAGVVMIPAHMGWPTVIMWPEIGGKQHVQFNPEFSHNWIPPDVLASGSYSHVSVVGLKVDDLVAEIIKRMNFESKS